MMTKLAAVYREVVCSEGLYSEVGCSEGLTF